MKLEECFERIDKYIASSDRYPRFINVNNINDMNAVSSHFNVGETLFVKSEDFAKCDNCISEARLFNFLGKETKSKKHCEIFSHNILNRNEKYGI